MKLGELIDTLKQKDQSRVLRIGFRKPHSYRGSYEHLSFAPAFDVPVSNMTTEAASSVGQEFCGWKGGSYTMRESTEVYLSPPGETTDVEITQGLLSWMFEQMHPAPEEDRIVGLAEASLGLINNRSVQIQDGLKWKSLRMTEGGCIAYLDTGTVLTLHVGAAGAKYKILGQRSRIYSIWQEMVDAGVPTSGLGPEKVAQLYALRVMRDAVSFLRGLPMPRLGNDADRLEAEFLGTPPAEAEEHQ